MCNTTNIDIDAETIDVDAILAVAQPAALARRAQIRANWLCDLEQQIYSIRVF